MVLVTSRNRLDGLVAHQGADRLTLRALSTTDSVRLLEHVVGGDRISVAGAAAPALAEACAGLPLALRIAGTHLAADPDLALDTYLGELRRGQALAALALADDEGGVRAAFDISYAKIDAPARRLFRLLGVVPGPDIPPEAAAALAGMPASQARRLLDRLDAAHLVDRAAPGRFTLHDLLRQYAQQLAAGDEERSGGRDRLFRWYLASSQAAAKAIVTWLAPPDRCDGTVEPPRSFADAAGARAWQDAERASLVDRDDQRRHPRARARAGRRGGGPLRGVGPVGGGDRLSVRGGGRPPQPGLPLPPHGSAR
jgi:hypothetical protein